MSKTAITAEPGIPMTDAEGNMYGFHGVPSPDGIRQTFEFEGASGHVCLQAS